MYDKSDDPYGEVIPYFMQIIEIARTGFNCIVLSGPHLGCELFFPNNPTRRWEIISRIQSINVQNTYPSD